MANILSGLLGAGAGFLTGGPVGAVVGGLGGLQAGSAQSAQKKAMDAQRRIAQSQQGLLDQASPYYQQLLTALREHAQLPTGYNATPGASPYTNVTQGQLGIFNNPTDRLRMLQTEEGINRGLQSRLGQLRTLYGRRGLTGSSIEGAGLTSLLADASRQRDTFARQLALGADQEYEKRLGLLAQALNPGLGAGPVASNIFGQQANAYGNQAAGVGANLGGITQNYALLQALRRAQNPATAPFTPGFVPANMAAGAAGGYGIPGAVSGDFPQIDSFDFLG